jgi:hypothetical protein
LLLEKHSASCSRHSSSFEQKFGGRFLVSFHKFESLSNVTIRPVPDFDCKDDGGLQCDF